MVTARYILALMLIFQLTFLLMPLLPGATAAAEPDQDQPAHVTLSSAAMLLRVGLALALVFGILGAVLFLYRRAARGGLGSRRADQIEILTQRSLGSRTSLALVRVAGESLLIGVTPQQISSLGRVPAEPTEAPAELPSRIAAVPASPGESSFAETLQGEIARVRRHLSLTLTDAPASHDRAAGGEA